MSSGWAWWVGEPVNQKWIQPSGMLMQVVFFDVILC